MLYSQRLKLEKEYYEWVNGINDEFKAKGDWARIKDCPVTFLSFLESKKNLVLLKDDEKVVKKDEAEDYIRKKFVQTGDDEYEVRIPMSDFDFILQLERLSALKGLLGHKLVMFDDDGETEVSSWVIDEDDVNSMVKKFIMEEN